jgi:hypothetical protein
MTDGGGSNPPTDEQATPVANEGLENDSNKSDAEPAPSIDAEGESEPSARSLGLPPFDRPRAAAAEARHVPPADPQVVVHTFILQIFQPGKPKPISLAGNI